MIDFSHGRSLRTTAPRVRAPEGKCRSSTLIRQISLDEPLASDIVRGRVQVGDNAFENRPSPAIAMAGDANGGAPTYADLATTASTALAPTTNRTGKFAGGRIIAGKYAEVAPPAAYTGQDGFIVASYDAPTQHNVTRAFAAYRTRTGLATIGYAISEQFIAEFNVAGVSRDVVIQVFERRVLTYTPANVPAFQVEMGNIGQHYYQWRYGSTAGTAPTAAPSPTAPAATTTPTPAVTQSGTLFTDPQQRFSLRYGDTWQRDSADETGSIVLALTHISAPISVTTVAVRNAARNLGDSASSIPDVVQNRGGSALQTTQVTIAGERAYRFTWNDRVNGDPLTGFLWVVQHRGIEVSIQGFTARGSDFSDAEAVALSLQWGAPA